MTVQNWNDRQQAILEQTFGRDIRRMAASKLPGTHQAVAGYHDRLQENKSMLKGVKR